MIYTRACMDARKQKNITCFLERAYDCITQENKPLSSVFVILSWTISASMRDLMAFSLCSRMMNALFKSLYMIWLSRSSFST